MHRAYVLYRFVNPSFECPKAFTAITFTTSSGEKWGYQSIWLCQGLRSWGQFIKKVPSHIKLGLGDSLTQYRHMWDPVKPLNHFWLCLFIIRHKGLLRVLWGNQTQYFPLQLYRCICFAGIRICLPVCGVTHLKPLKPPSSWAALTCVPMVPLCKGN